MMSGIDIKFQEFYKIPMISLRINGTNPFITRNILWLIHITFVMCINMTCLFLLSYSICMHDIRKKNFTEACKNISISIICINTSMKTIAMLYHKNSVVDLIRVVDKDYLQAKQFVREEQEIVKSYAYQGRLVCMFWAVCSSSGSLIFPAKAFILTAQSFWIGENKLKPMFDLTFPFGMDKHKDELSTFFGFFALCLTFAFFAATMYSGFDPLIPLFTVHICGQLDLVGGRITRVLSKKNTEEEMEEKIKRLIEKIQELYGIVAQVQHNFSLLNEFNMKTTTMVLPLIAFLVVEDIRRNVINYEFFILFLGAALHFLMPCYYSDLLMERSAAFRLAIYTCGWEKQPNLRIRRTILLMLTRASRPLSINSVFYKISLDTFANSIRQSYALFNLMCAAWKMD